jgi:pimeloyl-ACP methyl ester carboxylesterase
VQQLVDLGEVQLACTVAGEGPPLLLLHGAEGNHHMFDALVPHLVEGGFTVIAYDQRDCGETRNPARPATLAALGDDAAALLRALGHDSAFVYGTSFGGRVAQALAHGAPHTVRKLVLGSTWALPDSLDELNGDAVRQIHALRARLPESAEELAGYFLPASFLQEQPQFRSLFRNVQPHSERSARRQALVAERMALSPAGLRRPTLLLAGELDRVVPPQATLGLAERIPDSRALLLPGVGHAAVLQAPALVARHVLDFCAGPAHVHQEA